MNLETLILASVGIYLGIGAVYSFYLVMKKQSGKTHPFFTGVFYALAGFAWPYFIYKSVDVTNKEDNQ
jgi:hypothetical protein